MSSSDVNEKKGGILAIGTLSHDLQPHMPAVCPAALCCWCCTYVPVSLIGVEGGNATRISRFANYLRNLLPSSDPVVMEMASKAMGHLSMAGDTFTAEYVEFEVKRALEWLGADRNEGRRHAAVSPWPTTRTVCCVNRMLAILKLSCRTLELRFLNHV